MDKISLRRVEELADSARRMIAVAGMSDADWADTATALEALVRLVEAVDNADMDHAIGCKFRVSLEERWARRGECDCGVHPLQDALAQFTDDREDKHENNY